MHQASADSLSTPLRRQRDWARGPSGSTMLMRSLLGGFAVCITRSPYTRCHRLEDTARLNHLRKPGASIIAKRPYIFKQRFPAKLRFTLNWSGSPSSRVLHFVQVLQVSGNARLLLYTYKAVGACVIQLRFCYLRRTTWLPGYGVRCSSLATRACGQKQGL